MHHQVFSDLKPCLPWVHRRLNHVYKSTVSHNENITCPPSLAWWDIWNSSIWSECSKDFKGVVMFIFTRESCCQVKSTWSFCEVLKAVNNVSHFGIKLFSINLLVVYRESVNLIGYITRRLSADSQQLWIANKNRSPIYFDQSRSFKFKIVYHEF